MLNNLKSSYLNFFIILLCSCSTSHVDSYKTKDGAYEGSITGGFWMGKTPDGMGTWKEKNGPTTSGYWINGEYGPGEYTRTYTDGSKFVGTINKDGTEKKGILTKKNGDVYKGEFNNGVPFGQGLYLKPNGTRYEGRFSSENFSGSVVYQKPDGTRYEGGFSKGDFSGKGNLYMPDGTKYIGDFFAGKYQGQGTYYDKEWFYTGSFDNGKFNGNGTLTQKSGVKFIGEFKDNHLYYVAQYNSDGTLNRKGIWKANTSSWQDDKLIKTQAQLDQETKEQALRKAKEEQRQNEENEKKVKEWRKAYQCTEFDNARKYCSRAGDYSKCMQINYSKDYNTVSGWALEKECGFR